MRYMEINSLKRINDEADMLSKVYPIGSIYMSVNSTNPSTLFGGTWAQLKDRFLLGVGDSTTVNATGGSKTVTLTSEQMPSHTHTFTGKSHSHGLNSHKHTYNKADNTTLSHTLTLDEIPAHRHSSPKGGHFVEDGGNGTAIHTLKGESWATASSKSTTTTSVGGSSGHMHGMESTSTNTGAATGSTAGATQGGTNASTGGGEAHNNMPPYLTVYMWKRTA